MTATERKISAALGYAELNLFIQARRLLDELPLEARQRPDVQEISLLCCMGQQRWEEGYAEAQALCAAAPEEPGPYVHAAYCLHELGRTQEAMDMLRSGPKSLRTKAVYYYNLGCYSARLGLADEAVKLLERAFEMDPSLRRSAKKDPDLEPVREKLSRSG